MLPHPVAVCSEYQMERSTFDIIILDMIFQ